MGECRFDKDAYCITPGHATSGMAGPALCSIGKVELEARLHIRTVERDEALKRLREAEARLRELEGRLAEQIANVKELLDLAGMDKGLIAALESSLCEAVEQAAALRLASKPFLKVSEHANYYIGMLTGEDVIRLREAVSGDAGLALLAERDRLAVEVKRLVEANEHWHTLVEHMKHDALAASQGGAGGE